MRVSGFKSLQSRDDEVLEDNVDHDLLTGEEKDVGNKRDNSQCNRGEEDHRQQPGQEQSGQHAQLTLSENRRS